MKLESQTPSDTPRTDEAELIYRDGQRVPAGFARILERESAYFSNEIEELDRDKARLDWLESHPCDIGPRPDWVIGLGGNRHGTGTTLREAIDAAIANEKGTAF